MEIKNTVSELNGQIQKHLVELARGTDKARTSQAMLCYLDFCAKFHQYSPSNIWLIMLAKPEATFVAGFQKWKSMGRWVRKGERGISILAPLLIKEENEDGIESKQLVGFKVVYVFDVTQTEGAPLPPAPDWKSPEKNNELSQRLIQFAESRGISIEIKDLSGDLQGISRGGSITIDTNAGTKTLIHEIAHELMHQKTDNFQKNRLKELEAESVAYVVCKHFGLKELNSPNYIALHGATPEEILAHMESIRNIAKNIISASGYYNKKQQ